MLKVQRPEGVHAREGGSRDVAGQSVESQVEASQTGKPAQRRERTLEAVVHEAEAVQFWKIRERRHVDGSRQTHVFQHEFNHLAVLAVDAGPVADPPTEAGSGVRLGCPVPQRDGVARHGRLEAEERGGLGGCRRS